MFHSNTIDEALYTEFMEHIKQLHAEKMHAGKKRPRRNYRNPRDKMSPANYFSADRIAVYTVITGNYDNAMEPYCKPNNCDYFIFTDDISFDDSKSAWQKRDLSACPNGLSAAEKNRYLKMHPHKLFDDYNYSLYVDGNIQIFTDMTEYINRIGPAGIGLPRHPDRGCVFEEMEAVLDRKKETRETIDRHAAYMKETGMPVQYGLAECRVIARAHHNETCIRIMEQWWQEFRTYSKRDQISLPHVLYRNHIPMGDVCTLGDNIRIDPSFQIFAHNTTPSVHADSCDE